MSRRWRIGLTLLVGAAVFAVGVLLDGGDLSLEVWSLYLPIGLLLPAALTAVALWSLVGAVRKYLRERRSRSIRSLNGGAQGAQPTNQPSAIGFLQVVLLPLQTGLWTAILMLIYTQHTFSYTPPDQPGTLRYCVYPPSVWVVSALLLAGLTWVALFAWTRRGTVVGWVLFGTVVIAGGAAVQNHGHWLAWRENCRHEWLAGYKWAPAAERMIELWPDDWRGYANRAEARGRWLVFQEAIEPAESQQTIDDDIRTAIRLGCDDPEARYRFAGVYQGMSRHGRNWHREEAQEYRAMVELLRQHGQETKVGDRFLALTRAELDAEEFDSAVAHCESALAGRYGLQDRPRVLTRMAEAEMGRGGYQTALKILTDDIPLDHEDHIRLLGWLLATCPDDSLRDGSRAERHLSEAIDRFKSRTAGDRSKEAPNLRGLLLLQVSLAATLASNGEYDRARRLLDDCAREMAWKPERDPAGFWRRRVLRLDRCITVRERYRESPAK